MAVFSAGKTAKQRGHSSCSRVYLVASIFCSIQLVQPKDVKRMCFRLRDTQVRRHLPLTEQVAVRRGVSLRMCMQSLVRQKRHRPLASHSCLFAHRFSHPRLFGRIPSKPHSLLSFLRNLSLLTSLKRIPPPQQSL